MNESYNKYRVGFWILLTIMFLSAFLGLHKRYEDLEKSIAFDDKIYQDMYNTSTELYRQNGLLKREIKDLVIYNSYLYDQNLQFQEDMKNWNSLRRHGTLEVPRFLLNKKYD